MAKIVVHPDICNGQPTVSGTRIAAGTVLGFLSAGDSVDEVLAAYPSLSREDVLACLAYAADLLNQRVPWSDESARKATSVALGVAFAKPQTTAP